MTREEFPKFKKGDIVSDGTRVYCILKLQNKPAYCPHGYRDGWINGFLYLDADGFVKFQEYYDNTTGYSEDFKIVGHSEVFSTFLKEFRKELRTYY